MKKKQTPNSYITRLVPHDKIDSAVSAEVQSGLPPLFGTVNTKQAFHSSIALSHDSHYLAIGSLDRTIKVFLMHKMVGTHRSPTQKLNHEDFLLHRLVRAHRHDIISIKFSHQNSNVLISIARDNTIKVWDVGKGACFQQKKIQDDVPLSQQLTQIFCVGPKLWVMTSVCIRLMNLNHNLKKDDRQLQRATTTLGCDLCLDPPHLLAIAQKDETVIYDGESFDKIVTFAGACQQCRFNDEGTQLICVSASQNSTVDASIITIWSLKKLAKLIQFEQQSAFSALFFSSQMVFWKAHEILLHNIFSVKPQGARTTSQSLSCATASRTHPLLIFGSAESEFIVLYDFNSPVLILLYLAWRFDDNCILYHEKVHKGNS